MESTIGEAEADRPEQYQCCENTHQELERRAEHISHNKHNQNQDGP